MDELRSSAREYKSDVPWWNLAEKELGTKGVPGAKANNPRILEYLKTVGGNPQDETAWCSAFVNWVMLQADYTASGSALARSWLRWGFPLVYPEQGAIAVFWRVEEKGPFGHVGFYAGEDGANIFLLGGNQGPTPGVVSVANMPKKRLLGYRWPYKEQPPGYREYPN